MGKQEIENLLKFCKKWPQVKERRNTFFLFNTWTTLLVLKGVSLRWKEHWSTNYMSMETYREAT